MFINRLLRSTLQRQLPGTNHGDQMFAYRPRTVIVFHRTADVDTTGSNLETDARYPAAKQTLQARQPARLSQAGIKNFLFKLLVIELQHINLQIFARTKMCKDAGFAHAHALGQHADG